MFFVLFNQRKSKKYVVNSNHDTHEKAYEHREKLNKHFTRNNTPTIIIKKGKMVDNQPIISGYKFDENGVQK